MISRQKALFVGRAARKLLKSSPILKMAGFKKAGFMNMNFPPKGKFDSRGESLSHVSEK